MERSPSAQWPRAPVRHPSGCSPDAPLGQGLRLIAASRWTDGEAASLAPGGSAGLISMCPVLSAFSAHTHLLWELNSVPAKVRLSLGLLFQFSSAALGSFQGAGRCAVFPAWTVL